MDRDGWLRLWKTPIFHPMLLVVPRHKKSLLSNKHLPSKREVTFKTEWKPNLLLGDG